MTPAPAARFLLLAVMLALGAACSGDDRPAVPAPPAAVRDTALLSLDAARLAGLVIAPSESLPWRDVWTAPARLTLDPLETQSLGAIAEGRVTRVLARPGDRVTRGQVLVAVHSHEMMDAVSALAKATAAEGQASAERSLADHGAAVLVADRDALAIEADAFAPEHLELLVDQPAEFAASKRSPKIVSVSVSSVSGSVETLVFVI